MRSPSVLVASLALASLAAAEIERPLYYFPKHIKRVVTGGDTTLAPRTPDHFNARSVPRDSPDSMTGYQETGDQIPGALLSALFGNTGTGTAASVIIQPTTKTTTKDTKTTSHTSTQTSSGITFGPSGVVTTPASSTSTTTSTSSNDNLLGELLSGLLGTGTPASAATTTSATAAQTTTSTASDAGLLGILGGGTGSTTSTASGTSTTSDAGLLGILGGGTASTTSAASGTSTATTSAENWLSSLLGLPATSSTTTTTSSVGLGSILSSILGSATTTAPTSIPTSNSTASASASATGFPTTSGFNSTGLATTTAPSNATISTSSSSFIGSTNNTAVITKPSSLPLITTSQSASPTISATLTSAPQSIAPTGTNTATTWLPESIIVASSVTVASGSVPTSDPTGVPQIISPPSGPVDAPADSTLIQIGFLYQLNYPFVVENPVSSAQIYALLPEGLAYGLGLNVSQIVMKSLVPLNTTAQLGYITTIALAYIPETMVNTLSLDLHIPSALIYHNPSTNVNALMNYIDPAIPIFPGSTLTGAEATGTGTAEAATSTVPNSSVFNSASQQQSSSVAGKTAAIATGCVGAAAAYGAAMFFIARRYKKRRQSHRRSSSTFGSGPEMMQSGSPALLGANAIMSGGRTSPGENTYDRNSRGSGTSAGHSARSQQISGPMMAENSLGWN